MNHCSTLPELTELVRTWKEQGDRIVFTNGVFDILHIGHVTYLNAAKKLGDRLVVGINSDDSVRRLNKGPERPINPEHARAALIAALRCVDAVLVFTEDTPLKVIQAILPDVLVKGGDYSPEVRDRSDKRYIVGSDEVLQHGGRVEVIDLVAGFSTTSIVTRMREK